MNEGLSIAQHHKSQFLFVQHMTPSVLRPMIRIRKNSPQKKHINRGKMEETSGRATEEGSLSQDRRGTLVQLPPARQTEQTLRSILHLIRRVRGKRCALYSTCKSSYHMLLCSKYGQLHMPEGTVSRVDFHTFRGTVPTCYMWEALR